MSPHSLKTVNQHFPACFCHSLLENLDFPYILYNLCFFQRAELLTSSDPVALFCDDPLTLRELLVVRREVPLGDIQQVICSANLTELLEPFMQLYTGISYISMVCPLSLKDILHYFQVMSGRVVILVFIWLLWSLLTTDVFNCISIVTRSRYFSMSVQNPEYRGYQLSFGI